MDESGINVQVLCATAPALHNLSLKKRGHLPTATGKNRFRSAVLKGRLTVNHKNARGNAVALHVSLCRLIF